ncbi:MAG TPA: hypothetical protein PLS49_01360 [Candidatus Woesebacteria bacterium]|nr:hypothetical protein [Candidatus Woesebacteria bacterium]
MSSRPSRVINSYYRYIYIIVGIFICIYVLFKIIQIFTSSLFLTNNTRINTVFYGQETAFYSLDKKDARHYVMYFPADLKMQVPGGYGTYRVGGLGKLAKLDNNFDLLKKTFSIGTTSFVNYYFYEDIDTVFYGNSVPTEKKKPKISDIWLLKSNTSFFDKLYLTLTFLQKKTDDFYIISYQEKENKALNDIVFQEESFIKNSIGLLYQTQYRDEQKSVQIQYPASYSVAQSVGSLLEGNGIRVSDISLDLDKNKDCFILESTDIHSKTAQDLSTFFNCHVKKGNTDVYDIIFVLGNEEKTWKIVN